MSLSGGIELASLITKIKVDVAGFKSEMETVKAEAVTKAKEISNDMQSTAKVGESLSKVGSQATKLVTVPLLAAGAASAKLSMDLSKNMGLVATLLDGSVEQVSKRTDELKQNVYKISNDTGLATSNISNGLYQVISAFGDTADSAKILEIASKGAKAGNAEVTDSINLLSAVTKGYGDTSAQANQKVSDLAFLTAKLGQTTFPELAGAMGAVTPLAKQLNVTQEELFGTMATATGVTGNAAEVSTQFRGILQSLMAPTASMTTLMKKYGYENGEAMMKGLGLQGTIDAITAAAKESGEPLQSYIGSIEGQTLALALSGAQHDVFTEKLGKMKDATGATDEAFKRVSETTGAKFDASLNKAKNSLTKLGDALAPMLTKGAELIENIADKINNLTPEQQEMLVKIGLTVAAIGPLLKVGGSLITGYTKLKPLISGTTTLFSKGIPVIGNLIKSLSSSGSTLGKVGDALLKVGKSSTSASSTLAKVGVDAVSSAGGMSKLSSAVGSAGLKMMNCGGAVGKMGTAIAGAATSSGGLLASLGSMAVAALPWVAGAAAVGAAAYGIYKVLDQDVIPEVDLFKTRTTATFNEVTGQYDIVTTKVSEATQKQVQSYVNLSDKAQQESMNMYLGITKVTDESVASITGKVNSMAESIISATEKQKSESVAKYQDMFSQTKAITSEEQSEILATIKDGYDKRVTKTTELKDRISEIYAEIKASGGKITKSQQEEIDSLYNKMKEQAIQSMSSSKAEQEVILNNLNESSSRITADMAGKAIKEMNKIEKESIKSAKTKRDELVKQASELAEVEGGKYKDKADEIIKQANREYKETVKAAGDIKKEGIDKLMTSHKDLADEIDVSTGEVVSYWDKMFGKWDKWKPEDKNTKVTTTYVDEYITSKSTSNGKNNSTSHNMFMATGKDYIPYDGYNARLHKGERILNKKENEEYTNSKILGKGRGDKATLEVQLNVNSKEFAHATVDDIAEELGWR